MLKCIDLRENQGGLLGTLGSGLYRNVVWKWPDAESKKAANSLNYLSDFGIGTFGSDFWHFGTIDSGFDYLWLEFDLKSSFLMPYLVSSLCNWRVVIPAAAADSLILPRL